MSTKLAIWFLTFRYRNKPLTCDTNHSLSPGQLKIHMVYGKSWYCIGDNIGTIDVEMRLSYHLRLMWVLNSGGTQAPLFKASEVREASEAFLDVNYLEVQTIWYKLMSWSNDTWTTKISVWFIGSSWFDCICPHSIPLIFILRGIPVLTSLWKVLIFINHHRNNSTNPGEPFTTWQIDPSFFSQPLNDTMFQRTDRWWTDHKPWVALFQEFTQLNEGLYHVFWI